MRHRESGRQRPLIPSGPTCTNNSLPPGPPHHHPDEETIGSGQQGTYQSLVGKVFRNAVVVAPDGLLHGVGGSNVRIALCGGFLIASCPPD